MRLAVIKASRSITSDKDKKIIRDECTIALTGLYSGRTCAGSSVQLRGSETTNRAMCENGVEGAPRSIITEKTTQDVPIIFIYSSMYRLYPDVATK